MAEFIDFLITVGVEALGQVLSDEEASEQKRSEAEALFNRATVLFQTKRYNEAIDCYVKLLESYPCLAEIWYNMGNCYLALERLEEAINCYSQAIENKPDWSDPYLNVGIVLGEAGYLREAESAVLKTLELKPDCVEALYYMGVLACQLKRYDDSNNYYDKVIAVQPDSAQVWLNKGYVLGKMVRFDEAINCFKTALRLEPENYLASTNLAEFYLISGQYQMGLVTAEQIYPQINDPNYGVVCLAELATGYYYTGDKEKMMGTILKIKEVANALGGKIITSWDFSDLLQRIELSNNISKADLIGIFLLYQKE